MIREATAADIPAIAAWTTDTFDWGDYVPDDLPVWLRDPSIGVFVYDEGGIPIALGKAQMLSPTEAWLSSARVHPEHRGRRIAGAVGEALMSWARQRDGRIARLIVEDWNDSAISQVERGGMRRVVDLTWCHRAVSTKAAAPGGNGGRRAPAALRARQGRSADAEPAFAAWSVGSLCRSARGLFCSSWAARRLTAEDLAEAARQNGFWEVGSGWITGERIGQRFSISWIETSPEEAADALRAVVDLAAGSGADELWMWVPTIDWIVAAAQKAGCETAAMGIYAVEL